MRTLVHIIGWLMWFLGLGLSVSSAMNAEMMARIYRDSTYHSHQLQWEDGKIRKEEARAAMFDLADKYVAMSQRGYPIIMLPMAISEVRPDASIVNDFEVWYSTKGTVLAYHWTWRSEKEPSKKADPVGTDNDGATPLVADLKRWGK